MMETNLTVFALLIAALVIVLWRQLQEMNRRCRKLELQLDALLQHFGISPPAFPLPTPEVAALISQQSQRIEAIRLYRQQTGLGLKEASEALDYFARLPASGKH